MKPILAVLLLLLLHGVAFACLNEKEEAEPTPLLERRLSPRDLKAEAPSIQKEADRYMKAYKSSGELKFYQGYGVQLILLGKYDEALKVFDYLRITEPTFKWYSVAANLGTLYELRGENALAYKELARAIRRKPNAHWGSEWIHLNILDIKRQPGKAINSLNLIGVDFGTGPAPANKVNEAKLDSLQRQLSYQLTERMAFIQPKDSIVAHLLFDLANVQTLLDDYELARENYEWAQKYGLSGDLIQQRIANTEHPQVMPPEVAPSVDLAETASDAKKEAAESAYWQRLGAMSFPVIALLGVGIYFFVQRLRKRKS